MRRGPEPQRHRSDTTTTAAAASAPMHRRRRHQHHRHADDDSDRAASRMPDQLPLVVSLNCLEEPGIEQDALAGLATVEHVDLGQIASGKIEAAAAVLVHSLAFLPRAAQRRIQPWQLVLCLGSADRSIDSSLAADLGLRLVHVDVGRAEEVADTVMALFLGLLRRTHVLSRQVSSAAAASSGWLGSVQPLCRGMRRCRGLVLGIVGRTASARCLATRSLAFSMSVLYFDFHYETDGKSGRHSIVFPPAARRMDTLNDLFAASDLISLHCALSNETFHIINAECLQHIKPGAFLVNTGSTQLIDDCALKQLLIDGTVSGCALDGAEGPQWMEAWIREMPNVLLLPRSADYSEEVWMEIRDKAITLLQQFLVDGVVPGNAVSDEDEDTSDVGYEDNQCQKQAKEIPSLSLQQMTDESQLDTEHGQKQVSLHLKESYNHSQVFDLIQSVSSQPEGRCSHSGKKGIKRPAHCRSRQKSDDLSEVEGDSNSTSQHDDDTATSGRDQVLGSTSCFASPENSRNKQICLDESTVEPSPVKGSLNVERKSADLLKDGFVIALYPKNRTGLHVSRQRLPGGGWFLDTMSNVTKRDPAAQFLVTYRSKDIIGLRSLSSGGKLLQINRRMEFVFASHNFDVWESWMLEGSQLEECRLVNCRNSLAVLDVHIEIVATVGEQDGITRWID